jgi:hypothetical protein
MGTGLSEGVGIALIGSFRRNGADYSAARNRLCDNSLRENRGALKCAYPRFYFARGCFDGCFTAFLEGRVDYHTVWEEAPRVCEKFHKVLASLPRGGFSDRPLACEFPLLVDIRFLVP